MGWTSPNLYMVAVLGQLRLVWSHIDVLVAPFDSSETKITCWVDWTEHTLRSHLIDGPVPEVATSGTGFGTDLRTPADLYDYFLSSRMRG